MATSVATVSPPPAESPAMAIWAGDQSRVEQLAVGTDRVVDRGRERVLGREPVVEVEDPAAVGQREPRDEVAMRGERPDAVPAAVEVEHDPVGGAVSAA